MSVGNNVVLEGTKLFSHRLSDVECQFLEFWVEIAKWPWRSKSMTPIFNTSWENSQMHIWGKFGDSSSNPLQAIVRIKGKFSRILSDNGQNDQGQWLPFSIPAESIPGCMFGANFVIPAQNFDELQLKITTHSLLVLFRVWLGRQAWGKGYWNNFTLQLFFSAF